MTAGLMPSLGSVVQIAYLVDDVRVAAAHWATRLQAGPFLVCDHPPMPCVDRCGTSGSFLHSSAYGQWGAMQVELVQVHSVTPAGLGPELASPGGVHHIAVFVPSFTEAQQRLTRHGFPAAMTATTSSGMGFAFHDARASLGHFLEIYEPADAVLALYAAVAEAARGWNGEDPVRERL